MGVCQTFMTEFSCKKSLTHFNYFCKKTPSWYTLTYCMVDLIVHEIIQSSKCKLFWLFLKKDLQFHKNIRKVSTVTAQKGTTFVNTYHRFGVVHINLASTKLSTIFRTQLIIFVCVNLILSQHPPSRYLPVQSGQWKHLNNVWNLFKINNKDNKMTSVTSFDKISHIVFVFPLLALNKLMPIGFLFQRY